MNIKLTFSCVFFLALFSINSYSQIQLVSNGDFENNTFTGNLKLCTNSGLSDWTVTSHEIDGINDSWSANNNWPDGTGWYVDLVGSCSGNSSLGVLKSNSFDLKAHHSIKLSFQYGSELAQVDAKVSIKTAAGNTLRSWTVQSPSINTWFTFEDSLIVSESEPGCYLEFEGTMPSFQTGGVAIDNVSLLSESLETSVTEYEFGQKIRLFPNPSQAKFTIDLGETTSNVHLIITDIAGKQVSEARFKSVEQIHGSVMEPAGIYFITIKTDNNIATMRFIKR
ncbi:T9SS type A sorting domain-containing protein [bacterium SCSIO 12741]|nr:T9SS type A sorting domain-containing protein [bacterium SCSIO 12741]